MQVLTEIDDFPGFGFAPLAPAQSIGGDPRIAEAVRLIGKVGGHRVGFIGLACAPSTDGSYQSPILEVMQRLAESDRDVAAFDPAIYLLTDRVSVGAGSLCASADKVIDWCQTLVVTYHSRALQAAIAARRGRCHLIDLVDLFAEQPVTPALTNSAARCRFSQKSH
jgi:UDP-glucose 6-dehydrogenase